MANLFGLKWSPATAMLNFLKIFRFLKFGALVKDNIINITLRDKGKDIKKDIIKLRRKNKPITFDILYKQVFKDKEYIKLYNELGITEQLNRMIKKELDKA